MGLRSLSIVGLWAAACHGPEGDDTDVPRSDSVTATVTERGVQACGRTADREGIGPFERLTSPIPHPTDPWIWHAGIFAADVNADGWLDILTALEQGVEIYAGSAEGTFEARGDRLFAGMDLSFASGGSAADYDGDGDVDLYITRVAGAPAPEGGEYGRNRLLRNQGGGTFEDATDEAGIDGCGEDFRDGSTRCFASLASSWGDVDRDGDLDLFVGNYGFVDETNGVEQQDMRVGERDFLYLNNGDGTFADASDRMPPAVHESYTYTGGFHDLDADGDLDIYTVNDFGRIGPNRVLWNDGDGTFTFTGSVRDFDRDTVPLRDPSGLDLEMTGMGLGIGDLNGDGLPDLAIPQWKKDTLLESSLSRPGLWIDVTDQRGFRGDLERKQEVGWGTEMGDVDNDGDLDILNQYGHVETDNTKVWNNAKLQPDALFLNTADGDGYFFEDAAEDWGIADLGMSRGVVLADINRDGWLDIGKRSLSGTNLVYVSRCGEASWLLIDLAQPGTMNTAAIGARLEITAGGRHQTRGIHSGGTGYASSPPAEAHFGLGDAEVIDEMVVVWPDGERSVLAGVEPRQRITITRDP